MITEGERHELKTEVNRLNTLIRIMLQDYDHIGDTIPVSPIYIILQNEYFKELLAERQMLLKVLGILNLRVEDGFKLIPYNFLEKGDSDDPPRNRESQIPSQRVFDSQR